MRKFQTTILAGSSLLLLAACATTPTGPMIPVAPGPNKSADAFAADDAACQQFAANRVQGHVEGANNHQAVNGVLGAALGAGIGAAVAHSPATGAAIGAGAGGLLGTAAGAGWDQGAIQRHYDMAYAGCMSSRGNRVAGGPPMRPNRPGWYARHGYGPPPPPPGYGPGYNQPPPPPPNDGDDQGPPPPPPPSGS